jgi:hypothetical protein
MRGRNLLAVTGVAIAVLISGCGKPPPDGSYPFGDRYFVRFNAKPMCKREDVNSIIGPTRTELCGSVDTGAGRRYVAELQRLPGDFKIPSAESMLLAAALRAATASDSEIVSRQQTRIGAHEAFDITMQSNRGENVTFARYVLVDRDVITLRADLYASTERPADAKAFLDSFVVAD